MTPCIKLCSLLKGICEGCYRTTKEIDDWRDKPMEDRMRVMEEIKRNISTHDCPACSKPSYCAMEAGKSSNLCWCMFTEKTYNPETNADKCLCRECLTKE